MLAAAHHQTRDAHKYTGARLPTGRGVKMAHALLQVSARGLYVATARRPMCSRGPPLGTAMAVRCGASKCDLHAPTSAQPTVLPQPMHAHHLGVTEPAGAHGDPKAPWRQQQLCAAAAGAGLAGERAGAWQLRALGLRMSLVAPRPAQIGAPRCMALTCPLLPCGGATAAAPGPAGSPPAHRRGQG
jgi:hypothetical protein